MRLCINHASKLHSYRLKVFKNKLGEKWVCQCGSYIDFDMALGRRMRCYECNGSFILLDREILYHRVRLTCDNCRIRRRQIKAGIIIEGAAPDPQMTYILESLRTTRTMERIYPKHDVPSSSQTMQSIDECDECGESPCICKKADDKGPWSEGAK